MKKLKYLLLAFLLLPITAYANVYHCSAPGSVESGQSFSVTFYGNLSSGNATWSGKIGSEGNVRYAGGELGIWSDGASFSRTINYVAGNPGSASFYVYDIDVSDEEQEYYGSDTCTVTITEASQSYSNNNSGGGYTYTERSSNNNLKSITIEGVTISPEFNKDTLEYKAVVPGTIEKINLQAETEDDKAWIEGLGEKELVEGVNRLEIKVHAENDDEKVYIVEITRKEKNPIEVIINKKKYTVFKKESNVEPPKGFVKTTVVIDKQDVVAYSNEYIDYILVLLVDEEGNSDFYIYNAKNSTYVKYTEVKSKDTRLVFIKPSSVPLNYKKTKLKIDKEEVDAYYIKGVKDFRLVYGINLNNGEEGFYQYDMEEKTFQRYNSKLVSSVEEFSKKLEVIIVCAAAVIIVLFIIIISLASSKSKIKKAIKNRKENETIEKVVKKEEKKEDKKEEVKEKEPPKVETEESKKELTRKEIKEIQKAEKKKLKEEAEDFLK